MKASRTLLASSLALLSVPLLAQDEAKNQKLSGMGIEDLMNIEVTTASKRAQSLASVAAPIFVITQEDIRRSGATSIPELLRMVPGAQVGQIDSNKWAVSIRGFNSRFANKLLVLIDGRSVYTPLFSGVFWDAQDVLLEDVDRIEVVRGPGGALWGSNAVNGIINIITKHASETQDSIARLDAGTHDQFIGAFRQGHSDRRGSIRYFGKYANRAGLLEPDGSHGADDWSLFHGGFRADSARGSESWTWQGDYFHSNLGQTSMFPNLLAPFFTIREDSFAVSGWNLLGKWSRESASGQTTLQAYVDRSSRDMPEIGEQRTVADVDFQQEIQGRGSDRFVWGVGTRVSSDTLSPTSVMQMTPPSRTVATYSGFVHSEHQVKPDMRMSLGMKLEHNPYSGFEYQPSARLLWNRGPSEALWASVGRAVRTPNRAENDISIDYQSGFDGGAGLPFVVRMIGSDSFEPENVVAHEVGYRIKPSEKLMLDLAGFYNVYRNLRSFDQGAPFFEAGPVPHLVIPIYFGNRLRGSTHGLEASATWHESDLWHWGLTYSYLNENLSFEPGSTDTLGTLFHSPKHQAALSATARVCSRAEMTSAIKFVDAVPSDKAPAYWRFDLRFSWSPSKDCEAAIGANNLFRTRAVESAAGLYDVARQVGPSFYLNARWKF